MDDFPDSPVDRPLGEDDLPAPIRSTDPAVKPDRWGRGEDGLTAKQRLFVHEYCVDWNGTQAAIRAGYSKTNAHDQASENLRKPHIVAYIAKVMAGRTESTKVDGTWVLNKLLREFTKAKKDKTRAGRVDRIKIIDLIGRHVDVRAFRTQFGVGGPGGEPLGMNWNFAALNDEELETFERLLAKISEPGRGPGREGAPDQGAGSGAGPQ